ncbi:MAG: tetratricopeptide repeat protein [Candidatus Omnitrophota bacterium]
MFYRLTRRSRIWILILLAPLFINNKAFALDNRASFALSHYIMGGVYETQGNIDRAIQEYKKALKADYQSSQIRLSLASSYIKKGDVPRAIDELKLAASLKPEAVEPHAILALLYAVQEKSDMAKEEYESALKNASKLEPENIEIYKSLGQVYLQRKNYKEAEAAYKFILDLSPRDSEAHFFLAHIYDEQKNRQAAINELKKAIELNPDYHQALNYLGYIYAEVGRHLDEAEIIIKKALEFEPDNGAYVDSLGWVYFKQGKLKEALKELERADSLLKDPEIEKHLEEVREKLNAIQRR